jgi:metal-responsive CopG/Arc/MetJ family transcriptional regulator
MARSVKGSVGPQNAKHTASTVRLPVELLNRIDVWAGEHDAQTRTEAIRKLLEIGLTAKVSRVAAAGQRGRAATLADQQIDRMGDVSATSEERANRKRRLTEGPSAFREVRRDRKTRE